MTQISYRLDVFEGPLDLLLHLISKHKLNINDIPISELVEQYTSYVREMQNDDMDIASEFLEMAARLVYIKTVSLLPVHDEADKLKAELTGELLECRDCQIMAGKLGEHATGFDYQARTPMELPPDYTYIRLHETEELFRHYLSAVGRGQRKLPPPATSFAGIVKHKIVSVSSRIVYVLRKLWNGKKATFDSLYKDSKNRSELVATFLAVLELSKARRIYIDDSKPEIELQIIKKEGL